VAVAGLPLRALRVAKMTTDWMTDKGEGEGGDGDGDGDATSEPQPRQGVVPLPLKARITASLTSLWCRAPACPA
jgi:hypothetical protein